MYADQDEITELVKETAAYGGIYSTHIRGENDTVFDALQEALDSAAAAGVPLQVSHLKICGRHMWGRSQEMLDILDKAVKDGIDVTFDQYPYLAGATGLDASLPPWVLVGGVKKMIERLKDPEERAKMLADIENPDGVDGWISLQKGVGWENTLVTGFPVDPSLEGKTVAEIAEIWGMSPWDACCELLIKRDGSRVSVCYFSMGDEDMERIMKHPLMMVGSDSSGVGVTGPLSRGKSHPRGFGSFVKVLGLYARDKRLFTQEEAVRKMTSAPALRVGLKDRGFIRPGMKADFVLFDPKTVNARGDYVNPSQFPIGIHKVWVNGVLTIDEEEHTGAKAGIMLKPLLQG
jgi:N-acyl-D-amino-acid deacylase